MPNKSAECKPYEIVFICAASEDWPDIIWPLTYPDNLDRFIDDMTALGFAIWPTPTHIYVYTGETE